MMWLLEIGLVLLLVGGGWTYLTRGQRAGNKDSLTMRRVDAYIETIRRERRNPELVAMSDTELRDLLHSGAHNMKIGGERKNWILLGAGGVTLFSSVIAANQNGMGGFVIAMVVGALVIYGLNEYLTRRLRAPLERHGIDVERLKVE
ncbi:MAG: hypothetical protein ACOH2L_17050 [Devosia sp.]